MRVTRRLMLAGGTVAIAGCQTRVTAGPSEAVVEQYADDLGNVIDMGAPLEELSSGYMWSEGPTWDRARDVLYFTDVPGNVAYRWSERDDVDVFLSPSGAADVVGLREPGANGLWYARDGSLIICNHGRRSVERLDLKSGARSTLAGEFQGAPFNSPNDVVEARNGTLFFTDPPYGLEGLDESPLKAQAHNGVYRLDPSGETTLLVSDMTFPNGVALSPDETRLYVSQSDPDAPFIRELTLDPSGHIIGDRVIFDAKPYMDEDAPGLPDGLAICTTGHIFAAGPGGVFILKPDGQVLGRIRTGAATANCAFGEDGGTLFITAHDRLLKIRTRMTGVQWM